MKKKKEEPLSCTMCGLSYSRSSYGLMREKVGVPFQLTLFGGDDKHPNVLCPRCLDRVKRARPTAATAGTYNFYMCSKCQKYHKTDSKIGIEHIWWKYTPLTGWRR